MGAMSDIKIMIEERAFNEPTELGIFTGTAKEYFNFKAELEELEDEEIITYEGSPKEASREIVEAVY